MAHSKLGFLEPNRGIISWVWEKFFATPDHTGKRKRHKKWIPRTINKAPMASCQNREANRRQRSFHRGDSNLSSPSVCEMVEETSEEESMPNQRPDYVQHLCSILGYETAEYFLNPPPMDFQVSPSLQKILNDMEDPFGAEELWRILQEKSKQKLNEDYGEPIRPEMLNILKNFAQRPTMQKLSTKRHNFTYIRQTLQHHQDLTNMLLSDNPLPDINDHRGIWRPQRYHHQNIKNQLGINAGHLHT